MKKTKKDLEQEIKKLQARVAILARELSHSEFLYRCSKDIIENTTPVLYSSDLPVQEIIRAAKMMLDHGWIVLSHEDGTL